MFDLKNLPQFLFASVLLLMIQFRQSRQVDPQQKLEKAKLPIKMRKARQKRPESKRPNQPGSF